MGKPFASELESLGQTYSWAMGADLSGLDEAVRVAADRPLIAIGSGGSLTTASFASDLHRRATGRLAAAMTPMEAVGANLPLRDLGVMLLSAGGSNPDVLAVFEQTVALEPWLFLALSTRVGSPLARKAQRHRFVKMVEIDLPVGKDGFLATNSLIASIILIGRSYESARPGCFELPDRIESLLGSDGMTASSADPSPLWGRETLVVLHGPSTRAAAVDIESKFTEAALGSVQVADYRQFAHGRHHWLAKRSRESGVLALICDADRDVAGRTLALLPAEVPVLPVDLPFDGAVACLAAILRGFFLVGAAGVARGIDPGDPGVPPFGRKIYHLRGLPRRASDASGPGPSEASAIERKAGVAVEVLGRRGELDAWREAHRDFVEALKCARFQGVVLDYDGTLCDDRDRYCGPSEGTGDHLNRLLRAGIIVGIATGRGKSAREALRGVIPEGSWPRVLVGYYNGAEVGPLDLDSIPDGSERAGPALTRIAAALRADVRLTASARLEDRRYQVKVEPRAGASLELIWGLVQEHVHRLEEPGLVVLRSTHSMDVLAPGVTKRSVEAEVRRLLPGRGAARILSIGDRGRWPGNDYSLLSGPDSLSVDEASADPGSCWNLAPPGVKGVQAALYYLGLLEATGRGLKLGGLGRPVRGAR